MGGEGGRDKGAGGCVGGGSALRLIQQMPGSGAMRERIKAKSALGPHGVYLVTGSQSSARSLSVRA